MAGGLKAPGMRPALVLCAILPALVAACPAWALPRGMAAPADTATIFLPGVVSTSADEYGVAVTGDWSEVYFTRSEGDVSYVLTTRWTGKAWSEPSVADFSRPGGAAHPCLSRDGARLYFVSRRPLPGATQALNVWVTERAVDGWSSPKPLMMPRSDQVVHAPSVSASGTLYATGLVRIRKLPKGYAAPERLGAHLDGSHPAVAPDESFVVFSARRAGEPGGHDLYVSFARDGGGWSAPLNLGPGVNTASVESSPSLSSDGRFLFFSRDGDVWWVGADVIEVLHPVDDGR